MACNPQNAQTAFLAKSLIQGASRINTVTIKQISKIVAFFDRLVLKD